MKKKIVSLLVLLAVLCLYGCGMRVKMPFNGVISFHSVGMEIPEEFIRDSSASTNDVWAFEQGMYKKIIIISRRDAIEKPSASMANYGEYIEENGGSFEETTFQGQEAVLLSYTKDEKKCEEIMFYYDGSLYAVALRGGAEDEFSRLLDTVELK